LQNTQSPQSSSRKILQALCCYQEQKGDKMKCTKHFQSCLKLKKKHKKNKKIPDAETYQGLLFANPQLHMEKYPA
jgi:hypothetical protein